jgi:hypothetical protein
MIYDVRARDLVNLQAGLPEEDKEKVRAFVRRKEDRGYDLLSFFDTRVLRHPNSNLTVESIGRTKKTRTEFAVVKLNIPGGEGEIRFKIQTRYLNVVKRVHKHPVTDMFVEPIKRNTIKEKSA